MSIENPERTSMKNFLAARGYARMVITQANKESWDKFLSSFNPETERKSIWNKVHIELNYQSTMNSSRTELNLPKYLLSSLKTLPQRQITTVSSKMLRTCPNDTS